MAEKNLLFFNHQEVAEALIRKQGIHEGLWAVGYELGITGTAVHVLHEGKTTLTPAGIVQISRVGLQRVEESSELTVDASEVNPRESPPSTKRRKKRQK